METETDQDTDRVEAVGDQDISSQCFEICFSFNANHFFCMLLNSPN